MTNEQNRFFFEVIGNRWGEDCLAALVAEEQKALYQDMLNEVEKGHFHEAALLRGKHEAWESLIAACKRRADGYTRPRTE